jgi:uncharacterized repeat protein (TIGR02543 family)
MVRTGYTFTNWNTAANGSGTSYAPGPNLTMGSANVTLYAIWTAAATYTVTYNGNGSTGGTVPTDGNNYAAGNTVTVLGSGSLTRTDGVFCGWNTNSGGTGSAYNSGNTFAMGSGNVTLYAMWCIISGSNITSIPSTVTEFVIPTSVTYFGNVFQNLPNLTTITIPASITAIDVQAFLNCPQLTTIISNNTQYTVVNGALIDSTNNKLMCVPAQLSGNFTIPAGTTSIDPYAFKYCVNLTGITINASLGFISGNGFSGLQSAIAITLPSTITTISDYGFYNCSITSITIPTSVTSIGTSAFQACPNLTSITMASATPPTLGSTVFSAPYPTVHVPNAAAVTAYQSSSWGSSGVTIVTP